MYRCYIYNHFIVKLFLIKSFTFLDFRSLNLKLEVNSHKFFWEYERFYMFGKASKFGETASLKNNYKLIYTVHVLLFLDLIQITRTSL